MHVGEAADAARTKPVSGLGPVLLYAVPAAWFLPNHYFPWTSAWLDGVAMALLALGSLALPGRSQWPKWWGPLLVLALASVLAQWTTGLIRFGGDAWMVALYLLAFGLALAAGGALMDAAVPAQERRIVGLSLCLVLAAVGSVGIGLGQWTQTLSIGIYGIDLKAGARPYGNLAQPNHLCTAAFMGLGAVLALYEAGRLGRFGVTVGAGFLILGMVASGSRTGWLQVAVGFSVFLALRKRCRLRLHPAGAAAGLLAFAACSLIWPTLNEALALTGARALESAARETMRGSLWLALADALSIRPWTGFGWQQMVHAQWAVALEYPSIQRHFEYSHNLVLDLLVWAGLPVGGLLVGLLGFAVLRPLMTWRDPLSFGLYLGVLGLLVHCMLEFPHAYAYFLIPAGLIIGLAEARNGAAGGVAAANGRRWNWVVAPPFAVVLAITAFDYLHAEENYRILRLESARIGVSSIETPAAELMVLNQLSAFLKFARIEARAGMTSQELQWTRDVAMRFAYPPSMLRLALAEGLNGHPEAAGNTLRRLCAMHPPVRCEEARDAWSAASRRWPVLGQVQTPEMKQTRGGVMEGSVKSLL